MTSHLRANLVLVGATLLLCSVAYPFVVWVAAFAVPSKATGSIVTANGQSVGSELIAQEFTSDEYFQPRPSATSPAAYNAAASGASNWGANNPKLRSRIATQLGSIVTFRNGDSVGREVEKWFHSHPDSLAIWAKRYPMLANAWPGSDPLNGDFVKQWLKDHPEIVAGWKKDHPDADSEPKPEDVADEFFASFAAAHPGTVPAIVKTTEGDTVKKTVQPVGLTLNVPEWFFERFLIEEHSDIQGWFFDMWLQAHPDRAGDIEPVPADLVTASASGLDPHITLRNARYQLKRVAGAWAAKLSKTNGEAIKLEEQIRLLLNDKAFTPLLGFGGEPLVNVLEINLALRERYGSLTK